MNRSGSLRSWTTTWPLASLGASSTRYAGASLRHTSHTSCWAAVDARIRKFREPESSGQQWIAMVPWWLWMVQFWLDLMICLALWLWIVRKWQPISNTDTVDTWLTIHLLWVPFVVRLTKLNLFWLSRQGLYQDQGMYQGQMRSQGLRPTKDPANRWR